MCMPVYDQPEKGCEGGGEKCLVSVTLETPIPTEANINRYGK